MKSKTPLNIDTELSRCINQLLLKEPFYAHVIAGTVRKVTDEINTAAVGLSNGLILLMFNELFFLKELKSTPERIAVLKHEVLHLVFRHLFRVLNDEDQELYNIAADIVVNQYIGQWKLPKTAVTIETFPDLNLLREQNIIYYYGILFELHKSNLNALKDEYGGIGVSEVKMQDNNGSGSKKKNRKFEDLPMNEKYPISANALANIYNTQRHGNHSKWVYKNGEHSFSEDVKIDKTIASALEQSLGKQLLDASRRTPIKSYGNLPLSIRETIEIIRDSIKPKVDWKRQLKIFSSSSGRTQIYHTVKRISKRYGTRPGMRIKKFKKIAVVIDTSGSIDSHTLAIFLKEVDSIHKSGADVQIIECDAAIQSVYKYHRNSAIEVKGGGGTNYDPAFNYINSIRNLNIDGCIYLTDGYAPEPTIKPLCKLLYVITPNGNIDKHLKWGRIIQIKN